MSGLRLLRIGIIWWAGRDSGWGSKNHVDAQSALAVLEPTMLIRQVRDDFTLVSNCELPGAVWTELRETPFRASVEPQRVKGNDIQDDRIALSRAAEDLGEV